MILQVGYEGETKLPWHFKFLGSAPCRAPCSTSSHPPHVLGTSTQGTTHGRTHIYRRKKRKSSSWCVFSPKPFENILAQVKLDHLLQLFGWKFANKHLWELNLASCSISFKHLSCMRNIKMTKDINTIEHDLCMEAWLNNALSSTIASFRNKYIILPPSTPSKNMHWRIYELGSSQLGTLLPPKFPTSLWQWQLQFF